MSVLFPAIKPTDRSYQPGKLAQTRARSANLRIVRRPLASKQGGGILRLVFSAVPDSVAQAIQTVYRAVYGTHDNLILPPELFAGDDDLPLFLTGLGGIWRFNGPPQIEWIQTGYTNITVELLNTRRQDMELGPSIIPPRVIPPEGVPGDPGAIPAPAPDPADGEDTVFWLFQVTNESYDPAGDPGGVARDGQAFFDGGIVSTDDGFVTLAGGEGAPATYGQVHIQGWGDEGNRLWTASFSNGLTNKRDFPVQLVKRSDGRLSAAVWRSFTETTQVEKFEIITCDSTGGSPTFASYIIDDVNPAGTFGSAMIEDSSGNLWIVYCSHSTSSDSVSVVAKINSSMAVTAAHKYSVSGTEVVILDIIEAGDGSGDMFFIGDLGRSPAEISDRRMLVGKLESDLSTVAWCKSYNTTDFPSSGLFLSGRSIALGPSNTLIVTGDVGHSPYAPFNYTYHTFVAKLTQNDGTVVDAKWLRQVSRSLNEDADIFPWTTNSARKIYKDDGGNYVIGMTAFGGINKVSSYAVINITPELTINWQYELAGDSGYATPNSDSQFESYSNNPFAVSPSGNTLFHGSVLNNSNSALPVTVSVPPALALSGLDEQINTVTKNPWIRSSAYVPVTITLSSSSVTLVDDDESGIVTASSAAYTSTENDPTFLRLGDGVPPPSFDGATPIVVSAITYTQSSVYTGNTAATNAEMTNGSGDEATATSTDHSPTAFVTMDLGAKRIINNVIIGADSNNVLTGGWGASYTSNLALEYSEDGITWFDLGATPSSWPTPIQTISGLNVVGRYIRVVRYSDSNNYIALTEFYATTDP